MKTKQEQIIELFVRDYETDNFLKKQKAKGFHCKNKGICRIKDDPSWTTYIGDEDSKVVIVAEAPSNGDGGGIHIAGTTALLKSRRKGKGLLKLIKFVEENCGTRNPYFLDLMKCGLIEQDRKVKKELFPIRINNCIKRYLIPELKIIDPDIIICAGKTSYDEIVKIKKSLNMNFEIILLHHYGSSASLSLSSDDKEKYIWDFQKNNPQKKLNLENLINYYSQNK